MPEPTTHTLDVPGVSLRYDVRNIEGQNGAPVRMLIGSPMDASGFGTLRSYFPERTVVTYDPRGTRAQREDGRAVRVDARPARRRHAPHHRRARRPVELFATSGGAVTSQDTLISLRAAAKKIVDHCASPFFWPTGS